MLYIDYSAPKRETEYCDEHELVCLSSAGLSPRVAPCQNLRGAPPKILAWGGP